MNLRPINATEIAELDLNDVRDAIRQYLAKHGKQALVERFSVSNREGVYYEIPVCDLPAIKTEAV